MSAEQVNPAEIKARRMAAAILGVVRRAYTAATEAAGLKAGRKARRGGRSAYYRRPADFYGHGSRTFLKNKRKGF